MRAMRVHELGAGLVMDDVPMPQPGPGQVLLKVHACGVNFADTLIVKGRYQEKPPLPFAPGMEVCGTVQMLGDGIDTLAQHDSQIAEGEGLVDTQKEGDLTGDQRRRE